VVQVLENDHFQVVGPHPHHFVFNHMEKLTSGKVVKMWASFRQTVIQIWKSRLM